jgi:hypothetical protein
MLEFESGIVLFYFSFTFVSFGESCLLVSWCTCGKCGMACSDEDCGRSRRPGAEDRGWSHRRSRGRVAPCAICTVHVETRARVSWLSLKTKVDGLRVVWP